jgi:hypothetical protein
MRRLQLFIKLLAYRVLEPDHVRLPRNDANFQKNRTSLTQFTGIPVLGALDSCATRRLAFIATSEHRRHISAGNTGIRLLRLA